MRRAFLASFLGVAAAFAVAVLALTLLVTSSARRERAVPAGAVLVLDLSLPVADAPRHGDLVGLALEHAAGTGVAAARLDELVRALDHAAADPRVEAVLLTGRVAQSGLHSSWPALAELRSALERFRASGKPLVAAWTFWGEPELYLGSVAKECWIDPLGSLRIDGFAYERVHFARGLEALGVEVQVGRAGRFKSAVEPYVQAEMSAEARQQLEALLVTHGRIFHDTIAAARSIEPSILRELEQSALILDAAGARRRGLVDREVAADETDAELARVCGKEAGWQPERVALADYALRALPESAVRGARVAVLFAEGTIQAGSGTGGVYGEALTELVDAACADPDVQAVVLRINSPGGSVDGSERIRRALERLAAKKPLVVSMGAVAASGGYWIACPAHEIIAHPNTITGSIGVFSLLPNASGLSQRLGLDVHHVQSAEHSNFESLFLQKTPEQLAIVQGHVERLYGAFVERVATARGLERDAVHALAEGRVWSGERALELGLVDRLGHLDDAILAAARRAGLADDAPVSVPQADSPHLLAQLFDGLARSQSGPVGVDVGGWLAEVEPLYGAARELLSATDALGASARLPYELRLR